VRASHGTEEAENNFISAASADEGKVTAV